MMEITIHDVGHGACAVVTCPNGVRYMLDCGCSPSRPWFPSVAYAGETIDRLIIQNLDEDHVQDLSSLLRNVNVLSVFSTPHIDANKLKEMKPNGMRAGVTAAWHYLRACGPGHAGPLPQVPGVDAVSFFNIAPFHVTDTNNMSVATYFRWGQFAILFGGDLERRGWEELLRDSVFASLLPTVRVFVASHHGRENGLCEDMVRLMSPDIVIISDDQIQYASQNTNAKYRRHLKGIPLQGGGLMTDRRYVLTTRRDGTLNIQANAAGGYFVKRSILEPPARTLGLGSLLAGAK